MDYGASSARVKPIYSNASEIQPHSSGRKTPFLLPGLSHSPAPALQIKGGLERSISRPSMVRSHQIPVPVHPGPIDTSLLTRQTEHRSSLIWEGDDEASFRPLTFRRCDSAFWMAYPRAPSRVLELIDMAGFGGVSRGAGHLQVDHSLVTALIERWRPETHTFHLPFGEATITLQDIAVLWGLRVDGDPIIGTRFQRSCLQWQDTCEQLLGFRPDASAISGNRVLKHVLEDQLLADLPDDVSDEHFAQRARTFILLLLGGLLFSGHSGRYLPLRYLLHLEDLQISGSLSWGSAVLAHLYRCLCDASLAINREACGPMILLQIWAWERLPILRPSIQPRDVLPDLAPYAARWDMPLDCHRLPTHVLVTCRDQIDALYGCDQFVWTPYDERAIQSLPQQYLHGSDIWQARVPLICWEIVEEYLPDRVMRQFGMEQSIPEDCDTRADLHDMDSRAGFNTEWTTRHAEQISRWNARRDRVHLGAPSMDVRVPRPDYMDWYLLRTRLLIGNPALHQASRHGYQSAGSGYVMLASTVRQAMSLAQGAIPDADPHSRVVFESIRDLCALTITAVGSPSSHDMTRSMDSRMAALDRSKRRPRDRIVGRAQPGVRRGGRRRLAERHLGVGARLDPDGAAQLVVKPVPVEQDRNAAAEDQMVDVDMVDQDGISGTVDSELLLPVECIKQLEPPGPDGAAQPAVEPGPTEQKPGPVEQDRDAGAEDLMVDIDMVDEAEIPVSVDSELQPRVERIMQVEPPDQLGKDEIVLPLDSVDGQVLRKSEKQPQIPISWPSDGVITLAWVTELMQAFEWGSRSVPPSEFPSLLPVEVFDRLILSASKILHREPNCLRIDGGLGSTSRVVVVGDVHGQLHDVLFLLREAGYPGEDRFFVFNGDYVDRGAWGLETFLLLLAWKVLLPHRVFLLRGNHESKYCTSVYGFEKEVLVKYGDKGKHVYRKCLGCFEGLPLAAIIAGRVYTAHGGLFRSVPATLSKRSKGMKNQKVILKTELTSLSLGSLEDLAKARRTVLDPPRQGQNLIPGDILWSDPSMKPGLSPNKERGIGLLWGPDCTEEFLKKFGLKLIIRSHEGPDARQKRPDLREMDEGYTIDHVVDSGKQITIFSAPDYPQFQATEDRYRNKGAYVVLEAPDFDNPVFHSFEAVFPRPQVNPYYDYEHCIDSDEELTKNWK